MNMEELLERLKKWSDSCHKCIWCQHYEPECICTMGHEQQDWLPTDESRAFDDAIAAIESLYSYTIKVCPKCDGCGKLLLEGGIVESDGLHDKPCRIVCNNCKDPNATPEKPASISAKTAHEWNMTEEDSEFITKCLISKAVITKIATAPLKPFVMPAEQ